MTAVTLLPLWVWGISGLALSLVAWRLHRSVWPLLVCLMWIGLTLACSDDLSRWIRSLLPGPEPYSTTAAGLRLRVVTLNCNSQVSAASEAGSWKPDLVLLQESPSSNAVSQLARDWFGEDGNAMVGWDCSIIARGQIKEEPGTKSVHFLLARWFLPHGPNFEVASLRLSPPLTRLDLWSAACWREHLQDRLLRKEEMLRLVGQLEPLQPHVPLIIGGDFNTPADDAVCRLLKPLLKDTFREAGRGWGNTGINDFPISRPDQVWVSREFRTVEVRAVKTRYSDHRMVVCDLVFQPDTGPH